MRSAIMIPKSKPGTVCYEEYIENKGINSYSPIGDDTSVDLRGTHMQTMGYAKRAKNLWKRL